MTYLVKMKSGETFVVPENVGEAILEARAPKISWTKSNGMREQVDLNAIARVTPEEEVETSAIPKLESPKRLYNRAERVQAIEQLIKGIKKFMAAETHSDKSDKLLKRMEEHLSLAKSSPDVPRPMSIRTLYGYGD